MNCFMYLYYVLIGANRYQAKPLLGVNGYQAAGRLGANGYQAVIYFTLASDKVFLP
jgi:hypothetical protein